MESSKTKFVFFRGDKVQCIETISSHTGGPTIGEQFVVTSIDIKGRITYQYIGFKLPRYSGIRNQERIQNGIEANWGSNCFKLIERPKAAEVLYGKTNDT